MKTLLSLISIVLMLNSNTSIAAKNQAGGDGQTIFKCKNVSGDYIYQGSPCPKNYSTLTSWKSEATQTVTTQIASNGPMSFNIQLSPKGQYKTQGSVNSVPITFQIDTGANVVAIPQDIADQAGMPCRIKSKGETANGSSTQCLSIIEKMTFGIFSITKVPAMILPNLKQPLLGMNVLKMFRVEHEEDVMKISYKKP